jgi:hypothetical protein
VTPTLDQALTAIERLPDLDPATVGVACAIITHHAHDVDQFGTQHLPDGTGASRAEVYAEALKRVTHRAPGELTWAAVLLEGVAEVVAEPAGSPDLRGKLLGLAAGVVAWVEDIDRRGHDHG